MLRIVAAASAVVLVAAVTLTLALVTPVSSDVLPGATVRVSVSGGTGSGVILEGGYVLTAAHVVAGSPDAIKLTNADGRSAVHVEVMWISTKYDLALIKVKDPDFLAASGHATLECVLPPVGSDIRAEGNPLGVDFVSQWGKIGSSVQSIGRWAQAISIGAPLAPGMSGGPVYDLDGNVVGINVGGAVAGGFYIAVPSVTACMLMGIA